MTNDNWTSTQQAEIEATGLAPTNDLESAIVATLDPGVYTAIVRGNNNRIGVGLVEAYDLGPEADSQLANISTRGLVQSGDNVLIGGLIAGPTGTDAGNMLVRAIGPSLTNAGILNPLQDPTLEIHDSDGMTVAANDNWKTDQQTEIEATGLTPADDRESAILTPILPAGYTAIVRSNSEDTGIALVEVNNLN